MGLRRDWLNCSIDRIIITIIAFVTHYPPPPPHTHTHTHVPCPGSAPVVDVDEVVGSATVSATFPLTSSKSSAVRAVGGGAKIAGVRVTAGTLRREASCYRVMRNQEVVWQVGDEEPRGDVAGGCARPCVTRCLPACLPACLPVHLYVCAWCYIRDTSAV